MKRLVVACDGTWNQPERASRSDQAITNVSKIARAIRPVCRDRVTVQAIEYVRGVGTGNRLDQALGGLTGDGVSTNIEQAYHFIANNYTPGDDIYLFGFSRGAFTARSLSGFLHHIGILPKHRLHKFPEAYAAYRIRSAVEMAIVRRVFAQSERDEENPSIPVRFLGVWDTVGHLGTIPFLTEADVSFHDTELSPNVTAAYHALAVHELRGDFPATLWTKKHSGQTVQQVWFPGAHTDVGGGYFESGLGDLALQWMIDRATDTGLEFDEGYVDSLGPDSGASIHLSVTGLWRARRKVARKIDRSSGIDQYAHPSVKAGQQSHNRPNKYAELFEEAETRALKLDELPPDDIGLARAAQRKQAAEKRKQDEIDKRAAETAARKLEILKRTKIEFHLRDDKK